VKTNLIAFIFFFSHATFANEIPDYPVDKIATNTYVIHGPLEYPNKKNQGFMNNPGFVITNNGVVVIDPGSSLYTGKLLLRAIKKITSKPVTHVLNTHIHGDHWLGNQAFSEAYPKAILMAHPAMIAKAKAGDAAMWIKAMEDLTHGATKGTIAVIPDNVIDEAFVLKTGGFSFKIFAPSDAHSKSDIMIQVIEESVLFLGDNVLYKRIPRMDDGTFRGNINACDVAIKIAAKKYIPGHGPSDGVDIVHQYKDYLSTLYQKVAHYYDEGLTDFEMKPKVVAHLEKFQNWNGFTEEVGRHINLAMLEAEAASFE